MTRDPSDLSPASQHPLFPSDAETRAFLTWLTHAAQQFGARPDEVEDLVQSVLLKALLQSRDGIRHLPAWCLATLRHDMASAGRLRAGMVRLADADGLAMQPEPEESAERVVARVLAFLPERDRRLLIVLRAAGFRRDRAARALGMSPAHFRADLARLRAKARRWRAASRS